MLDAVRPGGAEVERLGVRSQDLGQGGESRVDFGVAERTMAAWTPSETMITKNCPFRSARSIVRSTAPRDVERADDVVPVENEVQGQMVAGPCRHDDHGQAHLGGHRAHHGLGAVAAVHAEYVDAAGGDVLHGLQPVRFARTFGVGGGT